MVNLFVWSSTFDSLLVFLSTMQSESSDKGPRSYFFYSTTNPKVFAYSAMNSVPVNIQEALGLKFVEARMMTCLHKKNKPKLSLVTNIVTNVSGDI